MTLKLDQRLQQGRYRIRDRLGQGGMGTVYLAEDLNLAGRLVAIKENTDTSPEAQEQFKHEAITLASLTHPNLPRVTDHFIESTGRQYLVMDYIQGDDLRQLQQEQAGPLPEKVALAWIEQVMAALNYMHNWVDPTTRKPRPIIHRDIKPGNIKQTPDGRVVLVDFGLAKSTEGTMTLPSARAVTSGYSPLEQYTGGTTVRSDIYALGATLYVLTTGHRPPDALTLANGITLPLPRKLNPALSRTTERVILRAMQLQPADRYATIQEMHTALLNKRRTHRFTETLPLPFTPGAQNGPVARKRSSQRSFRWGNSFDLLALLLLILLVTAGGVTWLAPDWLERLVTIPASATPAPSNQPATAVNPTESATNGDSGAGAIAVVPSSTLSPTTTLVGALSITTVPTETATAPLVATGTPTATALPTTPPTATASPVATPTLPPTATPAATPSATPTPPPTATPTHSPTPTPDQTLAFAQTRQAEQTVTAANARVTLTAIARLPTATATATPPPTMTPTLLSTPPATLTALAQQTIDAYATLEQSVLATLTARAPTATTTASATATAPPTPTRRPTVIAPPTATATHTPTNTSAPTSTPRPTSTSTPAPTNTPVPTSTPIPTNTPLPPTNTPAPTNTTAPTLRPTAIPALPVGGSVTLQEPLDSVLQGRRTFRWATDVVLAENQYFELVFWPAGRDPMSSSFGPAGSIKETSLTVDLDKTADVLPNLFQPGQDYQWGVLLVELNPYRRLQYVGGGHRFRFERSGGGGGGGGSAPAPTNTPRG